MINSAQDKERIWKMLRKLECDPEYKKWAKEVGFNSWEEYEERAKEWFPEWYKNNSEAKIAE